MNKHTRQTRPSTAREDGFSLIELLVVIVIIGIIAAIAIPIYSKQKKLAVGATVKADARSSVVQVNDYLVKHPKASDVSFAQPVVSADNYVKVSGSWDDYKICVYNANGDPSWAEFHSLIGKVRSDTYGDASLCGQESLPAEPAPSEPASPEPSTAPSTEPSTQPSTEPSTGPSTEPSTPAVSNVGAVTLSGSCGNGSSVPIGFLLRASSEGLPAGTTVSVAANTAFGTLTTSGGSTSIAPASVTLTAPLAPGATLTVLTGISSNVRGQVSVTGQVTFPSGVQASAEAKTSSAVHATFFSCDGM